MATDGLGTIEKKLADARKDLLDLTYRNRLINYRPAPKRSVLVVDEEPRELFDILVIQGKRMQFSPRPKIIDDGDSGSQPDQVSEEDILANDSPMIWTLPDQDAKTPNNHTDLYLQTNLESEFLQKRLFYIAQESKSVFEEQGYTILYLATGFLEWTETPKGVVHKAPLILIPVEIERDKIRTSFKLAWTGEDLITNISLQAKLSEINVNLPSFEMPEKKDGIDLYFKTVTDSIKGHENWQVTREIHLDFFTYSKFVMYRDLDPVAWPGENSPALHPLITSIFGDGPLSGVRSSKPFPEQEIDARLPTRSVYHVRDADSSQIAVIEDLKSGMNLVVEGPPGTGKSQTIVNVIAEFLAIGKTVLFVSEKMAALEVVKGRLDSLGLGNFCLELHNSKKANKKKVLGEIQRAIGLRCPVQKDNDEVLQNVEDLRNVLNRYTTALSAPVGRLGFTPYDLYGMLESARRNFVANGYHVPNVTLPPPDSITPDLWSLAITTLKEFDTMLPLVSPVKENPWRFCTPGSFFGNDVEEIMHLLSSALENLSLIRTSIEQLVDCAGIVSPTTQTELVNAVPAIEIMIASEPIDRSVLLNESWNRPSNEAEGLIQKIERYQAIHTSLTSCMEGSVFTADLDSLIDEFEKSSEIILHSFIEPNNTIRAQNQMPNGTLPPLDSNTLARWSPTIQTLEELEVLLPSVSPVKENPWRFCTPGSFVANDVEEIRRHLSLALENLSLIRTHTEQLVECAGIVSPTTQTELVNTVHATEMLTASEPIDRSVLLNESWNRPNNDAEGLIQKVERYQAIQTSLASSMQESVFSADLDSLIDEFEMSSEKILHSFIEPNNTTRVQNQMHNGALPPLDSNTPARWSSAIRILEELEVLLPSVSPVKENPWRFCTPGSLSVHDVEEVNRLLSSALENLSLIQTSIEQLVECAGIAYPTTRTELVNTVHATEMLTASEPIDRSVLLNESWNRPNNEAEGLIQKVELFQAIQASITSSMQESVFTADLDSLIDEFEMSSEKILHSFIEPNNTTRVQNQMHNGALPPLDSNTPARWSPAIRTLEELDALLPSVSPVKENPWRFCTPGSLSVHDVEEVNRLLSSALENLSLIQTSIEQLVECAGIASPTTQTELVNAVHATEILTASEPIDRSVLLNESWDRTNNEAEGLIQKIEAYQAFRASLASSMRESVFAADLNSLILEFETSSKKILHSFVEPYKKIWITDQRSDVTVPSSDTITLATWSSAIRKLEELDTILPFVSPVKENPWRFCTPGSFFANDVTEIGRLLSYTLENLSLIRTSTKQLIECTGITSPTTQTELVNAVHATEMLIASEPIDQSVLLDESWDRTNNETEELIQKIEMYQTMWTSLVSRMQTSIFIVNLDSLIPEFESSSKKILRSFRSPYNRIRDQIDGFYLTKEQRSDEALLKDLRDVQRCHSLKQEIHDASRFGQLTFGVHWREEESCLEDLRARSGWIVKFRHELLTNVLTPRSANIVSRGVASDHARDLSATIKETRARFNSHMATLFGRFVADTTKYFPCGIEATPFDDMQIILQAWLTGINRLVPWTQYLMIRKEVDEIGLESVKAADLDSLILGIHALFVPYKKIRDRIDGYYLTPGPRSDETLLTGLHEVQRCHALKQEIYEVSNLGHLMFGAHWREEQSSPEHLHAISGWIMEFRHALLTNVLTPRSVEIVSRGVDSDRVRELTTIIEDARGRFNSNVAELIGRLTADTSEYFPSNPKSTPFTDIQAILQAWFTEIDRLVPWTRYLTLRKEIVDVSSGYFKNGRWMIQYPTVRKEVEETGQESDYAADLDIFILDIHALFVPYKKIRDQIDGYYLSHEQRSDEALITSLREVQRCHVLKQEIQDASSFGQLMFGAHWREEQSSPEHLHAFSEWIVKFRHELLTNVLTPRSVEIVSCGLDSDRVRDFTTIIEDARGRFNSNVAELSDRLAADSSKYFPRNPEFTHFTDIQAILQAWLTGIDRLVPWTRYLTLRKEIAKVISGYYENGRWVIQYPTVRKEVEETGQESDYAADLDLLVLDLHSLFIPYKKIRDQIDGYYLTREPRSDEALITGLHEVQRCHVLKQEIHDASSFGHLMFGVHWCGEKSNPEYLHAFSRWIVSFRHALLTNVLTPRSVEIVSQGVDSNRLHEITSMIEEAHAGFNSHVTELLGRLAVDSQKYFHSGLESTHFTDIEAVFQAWLTGIDRLMPWAQYMTVRKEVEETMKTFRAAVASSIQKSNYATDLDTLILDLHSLLGPYSKIRAQIDGYYLTCEQRSDFTLLAGLREVQQCQALNLEIHETSSLGQLMFGVHWRGEESSPEHLHAFSGWIVKFRHELLTSVLTPRSVEIVSNGVDSERIREITTTIEEARARFNAQVPELLGRLAADTTKYFPCGHEATRFDDVATILESWLLDIGRLVPWTQYLRVRKEVEETIAAPLMPLVEQGQLQGGDLQACLKGNYALSLLRLTFAQNSALDRFVGHVHEQRIKDFVDCDRQMIQENQVRIAQRLCKNRPVLVGGASPSSEIGFLQTEINRKRGHASIRQLLTKAMKPIQQIKPCFMMSPPSIAQFLDPSLIKFDIVIFDEASQVKPAEALGAILRGKQVAVIGDSRQLPPTSFFDKIVAASENEDGDDAMPSDMESVLNLCKTRFPSRTLLWHYRSRHDSLIGLSNKEFYNNELYVFPSPMRDGEELGLKFVYLPETIYDRGKSGMNRGEARAVAEAVFEHAHRYPNRSLGVGTFNIHQQEAILEELERLRGEKPDLEEFFADKGTETFFVKNLETIQGDERDVIFLSLGFGYDIQHKLSMNFGALNKDGGERRLNVLITRARRRCVVFANFRARELPIADIQTAPRGVQVLKLFLEYAETGKVPCTMEPPANSDSPFEEAVYAFLTEYGYVVHKRVGCIGYQIDLAVVNPDILGEYLIGIECDGATYYSSRVARDRDRLRLEILEGLGWRIHRVWSTDWFRDPGACQNALIAAIDQALETGHKRIILPEPVQKPERSAEEGVFQAESESVPDTLATTLPPDKEMPLVPAYVICDTLQIQKGIEPKDYLPGQMATLIAQVVNIEGPVHYDEVIRRIRDAFDVKRTGNQIRAAIDAGGERAVVLGTVVINGEFFWPMKRPASIIRRRGEMIKPRIEMICNEELEEAVWLVLKWQYATEMEALATGVCHVVGIRKVSGDARKRVQQVIAGMMSRGMIEEKPNGLIDITMGCEKVQSTPPSSRWDRMKID